MLASPAPHRASWILENYTEACAKEETIEQVANVALLTGRRKLLRRA